MSGSELSVECELRNRKNQTAYLLADNRPAKSRRGFLPSRNLQIHQNKLAQQVNLVTKKLLILNTAFCLNQLVLIHLPGLLLQTGNGLHLSC